MFSYLSSNCVFNIIEYFSYLNLWLIILFLFIMMFFLLLSSCQLLNSSKLCSDVVFESSLTLFSLFLIAIIISPALIILLDSEIIIIPSFIVYSCGYQWAWTFSVVFMDFVCNFDHYIISSYYLSYYSSSFSYLSSFYLFYYLSFNSFYSFFWLEHSLTSLIEANHCNSISYIFNTNTIIIFPLLSTIRLFVFSFDVIHSLGIYSFGIKIDAIPGRFNFTSTIRTLIKGEHRGFCYELCGHGHSSMLIVGMVLFFLFSYQWKQINSFLFILYLFI